MQEIDGVVGVPWFSHTSFQISSMSLTLGSPLDLQRCSVTTWTTSSQRSCRRFAWTALTLSPFLFCFSFITIDSSPNYVMFIGGSSLSFSDPSLLIPFVPSCHGYAKWHGPHFLFGFLWHSESATTNSIYANIAMWASVATCSIISVYAP